MRKILVISADPETCAGVAGRYKDSLNVLTARTAEEARRVAEAEAPAAALLDAGLSGGLGLLDEMRARPDGPQVIAATAPGDMAATVETIKRGAFDCITKPVNLEELDLAVRKIFHTIDLHKRLKDLLADAYSAYRVDAIVGKSRAMDEIFKTIAVASEGKVTVLIQGESGTGKELIARAIHYNSREKDKPFLAINCSALVETLLESELFGHEKGAFTGAIARKEGKFEAAHEGTVFLDEIGEMSPALQVKLLRVLQERSFERVGSSETIKTGVRVIAATNKDLNELTERRHFRNDLYYRLKVITIDVPPLRERKEDIPLLVSHLLEKARRTPQGRQEGAGRDNEKDDGLYVAGQRKGAGERHHARGPSGEGRRAHGRLPAWRDLALGCLPEPGPGLAASRRRRDRTRTHNKDPRTHALEQEQRVDTARHDPAEAGPEDKKIRPDETRKTCRLTLSSMICL
ncbi:MAG: sigma-54-dependent Fis family transcriptional regulator [Deltaproteobacteria bacterium]|nr:sigma-54-dependent Fis family transcriptional regulator [Deltaproteobacteria bacterium]